jgi:hypothetical protein
VGLGGAWDHEALEAHEDERRFALRYTRGGRLVGVCSIGGAADLDRARAEIAAGAVPERAAA